MVSHRESKKPEAGQAHRSKKRRSGCQGPGAGAIGRPVKGPLSSVRGIRSDDLTYDMSLRLVISR